MSGARVTLVGDLGSSVSRLGVAHGHEIPEAERHSTPESWEALIQLVLDRAEKVRLEAVKLGIAGAVRGGWVSSPRRAGSFPFGEVLTERLRVPVKIANDLYCVALGELKEGAAQGVSEAIVVTVSTGLGAVIIKGGAVLPTPGRLLDEYGHRPVPRLLQDPHFQPAPDVCGRLCYDRYASGSAVLERARQKGLAVETGRDFDALAERHDPVAWGLYQEEGRLLAEWIAGILDDYPVGTVILQGTFARRGFQFFRLALTERLKELVENPPKFRMGELGDDAGLIGATYL